MLDGELGAVTWIAGSVKPSVADVALCSYIDRAPEENVDLSPYTNVRTLCGRLPSCPDRSWRGRHYRRGRAVGAARHAHADGRRAFVDFAAPRLRSQFARLTRDASDRDTAIQSQRGRVSAE